MRTIRRFARKDPSGTLALLNAAAAVAAALVGYPEFAPVFVAAGVAVLGLRTQVTPTRKADETLQVATTQVALDVASNLTDGSAGTVGEITGPGAAVVDLALEHANRLVAARR